MRQTIAGLTLAFVSTASCHGGGMYYNISGVEYTGTWPTVLSSQNSSIQRLWSWDALDPTSPSLACNSPGTPLSISPHAPVDAGSTIAITYLGWPHAHGPMLAYLAACPSSGCESVDLTSAVWFKIWQAGLLSGNIVEGEWAMAAMATTDQSGAGGATVLKIPLPAGLEKGKYLLKHDMANLEGGRVQLFPNCVQLDVGGEGMSAPKEEELVVFPGGYDKDAGISWADTEKGQGAEWLYLDHAKDTDYAMPGPPLWSP